MRGVKHEGELHQWATRETTKQVKLINTKFNPNLKRLGFMKLTYFYPMLDFTFALAF